MSPESHSKPEPTPNLQPRSDPNTFPEPGEEPEVQPDDLDDEEPSVQRLVFEVVDHKRGAFTSGAMLGSHTQFAHLGQTKHVRPDSFYREGHSCA